MELKLPIPKVVIGQITRNKRKSAQPAIAISRCKRGTMLILVKKARFIFVTENYQTELCWFAMDFHLKTTPVNMFG